MASASMDSMTPEVLRSRVLELEAIVEEYERDLYKAATVGKSLLEENGDLHSRIKDMMRQQAEALEDKQQEVSTLQSRLDVAASSERWMQEEINNLRAELQTVQASAADQVEEQRKQESAGYKKQIESLRLEVENLQGVEQELRERVAELESLLESHLDRTQIHSISSSFSSEEMAQLHEELANLKMDMTEIQAKNIDLSGQLQQAQREKDMAISRLEAAKLEIEDLQCQVAFYSKHLEESRREMLEVRAQVDVAQLDSQLYNPKGNSLFSEVDDRRLVLEKMMASQQTQSKQLKEKYEMEKQRSQMYKMEIAIALQMTSRKNDSVSPQLMNQLAEARAEIQTLSERLQALQSASGGGSVHLGYGDFLEKAEDKNYAQYLLEVIKMEKKNASKVQDELHAKRLQYHDASKQILDLSWEVQELKKECNKLRAEVIRADVEKEELLLKYDPDKAEKGKAQNKKKVVEKIDLGVDQSHIQEALFGTSGRPSDIFKAGAGTTKGRPSNVLKPSAVSNVLKPANVSLKPSVSGGRLSDVKTTASKYEDAAAQCKTQ